MNNNKVNNNTTIKKKSNNKRSSIKDIDNKVISDRRKSGPVPKYEKWLKEENLAKIEQWASEGLTDLELAYKMGIVRTTLAEWKVKVPLISDTIKKGKEKVDRKVEQTLLERAMGGYKIKETKKIIRRLPNGEQDVKIEEVEKEIPADITAIIFWLKNRMPKEWRDKQNIEVEGNVETNTKVDLSNFTKEELLKIAEEESEE